MNPSQVRDNGDKTVSILSILTAICIHGRDTGGIVSVVESCDVPEVARSCAFTIARTRRFRWCINSVRAA